MTVVAMEHARDRLEDEARQRVGRTINEKYRLDALLGVGATGAVYRAQNVWAGRACAVKVFHYEGPEREHVLKRFVREAQATNRVLKDGRLHPNVVDAIDVGSDAALGVFFVVQELLRGETLEDHLARAPDRRLDAPAALALLRPVVDAMACAHEAGIVHRDLKPDNLFLEATGGDQPTVKVLDFGIAQLSDARLTSQNELLGTPLYMPPEAFRSAAGVDARADVWALGAIFYEMVAGVSPFEGVGDLMQTLGRIVGTQPASLASAGRLPPTLWNVVRRCLAKNPDQRYPTAGALLAALDDAVAPLRVLRVPPGLSAAALARALEDPSRLPPDVLRSDPPDAPPPADPARAWWRVVFQRTAHTSAQVLEVLALPALASVVELHLLGVALGDDGVKQLAASPRLAPLTGLSVRRAGLGDAGVEALAQSPHVENLVGLDLAENPLGPAAVAALARSPRLAGLRILNLLQTAAGDEGARALARSSLLARLARLDLSAARLTEAGVRALAESPHLREGIALVLAHNDLAPDRVAALQQALGARVRRVAL